MWNRTLHPHFSSNSCSHCCILTASFGSSINISRKKSNKPFFVFESAHLLHFSNCLMLLDIEMDCNNGSEFFQWQDGVSFLQKDSTLDISDITWDGNTQDKDLSYILDQTTPIKACGKRSNDSIECQFPSSRVKRRRVLQFDDDVDCNLNSQIDDITFLKSKERTDEAISDSSRQGLGSQEASSFSGLDCLEDQVEDWLGDCFNYSQTNNPTTDISFGTTDVLLDISEFMGPPPPKTEVNPVQKQVVRSSRNATFIGTKSYIQTQTTQTTFKIQPFTFIKPSMANGELTLKEINQHIQSPPIKLDTIYETSAFSGKPVVNKTRIKTEGGEGSITIMRTQG